MNQGHALTTLNELTLTILRNGTRLNSGPVRDFDSVSPDLQIFVEGTLPKDLFVYVLQLGPHRDVLVLHHPTDKSHAALDIRVPTGTGFLTTAVEGEVTVVGSASKVMDSEWPRLLGGHDGEATSGNLKESKVGPTVPPSPPAKPPTPPATNPPPSSSGH